MIETPWSRIALAALASSAFAFGCTAEEAADEPQEDTSDVTSVVQSGVKNQSIGNCWIYAHTGWVEALNKRATKTELNLSESYASYWDWFTKVTSWPDTALDSKGAFSAGGTWTLYRWEVARYGVINEADFIPEEATNQTSSRQSAALRAFSESLKNGALKTVEARKNRALVRAELDKAFGLSPAVIAKLDKLFGKDGMKAITQNPQTTRKEAGISAPYDIAIAWPNATTHAEVKGTLSDAVSTTGQKGWKEANYPQPTDEKGRRAFQIRVQKALNDQAPAILWWNVDFNALSGTVFSAEQLAKRGAGRTGGHMTLGFDYQVKLANGTVLKAGETVTDRKLLDAAVDPAAQLQFLRVKNSWGGTGLDGVGDAPPSGYYDLDMAYLNGKVADGYGWVAAVLPPGY
jgi:hypothetical protein